MMTEGFVVLQMAHRVCIVWTKMLVNIEKLSSLRTLAWYSLCCFPANVHSYTVQPVIFLKWWLILFSAGHPFLHLLRVIRREDGCCHLLGADQGELSALSLTAQRTDTGHMMDALANTCYTVCSGVIEVTTNYCSWLLRETFFKWVFKEIGICLFFWFFFSPTENHGSWFQNLLFLI